MGINSKHELLPMLTFYHDLGYVVYYGGIKDQESLLRDMVILNPQWLIDVFKQVITIPNRCMKWWETSSFTTSFTLFCFNYEINGKWALKTNCLPKGPMQSVLWDILGDVANWCLQAGHYYHGFCRKGEKPSPPFIILFWVYICHHQSPLNTYTQNNIICTNCVWLSNQQILSGSLNKYERTPLCIG